MRWLILIALLLPTVALATDRLYPSDLTYHGAFRVPDGTRNSVTWIDDPHRNSGMGWDSAAGCILIQQEPQTTPPFSVTECLVPATPVISSTKTPTALNRATAASGKSFTQIALADDAPYILSDVEYYPQQTGQTSAKYYWMSFDYYEVADSYNNVLGWSDTDFASPNPQGKWHLNNLSTRVYDKYMLKIDPTWAAANLGYEALGVGRSRTNGSEGPGLYAIRPWHDNAGDPPVNGAALSVKKLMEYNSTHPMESFSTATSTKDAVWLKSGSKAAFVVYQDSSYREDSTCAPCGNVPTLKWWHSSGTGRSVAYKETEAETQALSASIDASQTTIQLSDVSKLPPFGRIKIKDTSEHVSYTGKSGNTLTGCIRGVDGTTAAADIKGVGVDYVQQVMPDIADYQVTPIDGQDALVTIPMLLFFDVDQIAEIANETRQPYDIQPFAYMTLDKEFYRSMANRETKVTPNFPHGITWDGSGNVYIGEYLGDTSSYKAPLIHKYTLGTSGTADTTAPATPATISVDGSGNVSWSASNEDVTYVIFKWYDWPHYSVSGEYRPIRTTLDTTWTDPLYQPGDKYQVIAHDRNMNASAARATSFVSSTGKHSTGTGKHSTGTGKFIQ